MPESRRGVISTFLNRQLAFGLLIVFGTLCLGYTDAVKADVTDEQTTFTSAEDAFKAVTEAYRNNDETLLISMFGNEHKDFVVGADKTAAREDGLEFAKHYDEYAEVTYENDNSATLVIGKLAWPYPIPAVKEGDRWRLDAAQGKEELLRRQIGRDEFAAIDFCNAYIEAQRLYATEDRDGDDVLEYARKMVSSPDNKDGLYWKSGENEAVSPFEPLLLKQSDYFEGKGKAEPYWGYFFHILPRQGYKVPGGKYEYVINGNMIAGFALVGYPAEYGSSGIMTFLVNHQGQAYQKDLGEDTPDIASKITEYNPDETWTEVSVQ